jgi:hypothetical protein
MDDYTLVNYAQSGIGNCRVQRGAYGQAACAFYMKVNGYGFPQGTGCTDNDYTSQIGCYSSNTTTNTACVVRIALQERRCL